MTISFEITHNISSSKGWGRYKASAGGKPIVKSSTDNEWVSAPHNGEVEEGAQITATLQTMTRTQRSKKETVTSTDYHLIATSGANAELGYWNGLAITVTGARLAD